MPDRAALRSRFLESAGWAQAICEALPGDASLRKYFRLTLADGTGSVLMDAPPESCGSQFDFLRIAKHLRHLGLSAPRVIASDVDLGMLLLEDLGSAVFSALLKQDPALEDVLYLSAVELLLELHTHPAPSWLARWSAEHMADLTGAAFVFYADVPERFPRIRSELAHKLREVVPEAPVLVHRDYHVENLIWLPDRTGVAKVGLIDFQDAFAGHPAYDIASIVTDARRDLSPGVKEKALAAYVSGSGVDPEPFLAATRLLSVQRNLRILGVFARLARERDASRYVAMLPRVWSHVMWGLQASGLENLLQLVQDALPPPDVHHLAKLRSACAAIRMP